MAIISWKMLIAASVCVIVASLGAASEMYDEMPPGDLNLMYPEHNFIEPGPQGSPSYSNADMMKNLFLYKMFSSLGNDDVAPNVLAGPKWISSGTVLVPPETFELSMPKGYMKRGSGSSRIVAKVRPSKPATRKWKIKKGKVGSQMICYFKLCAFRPPV